MSDEIREDGEHLPAERRGMMRFRRSSDSRLFLPPDSAKRQGAVTSLAFQLLGRDRAIAFLNANHSDLDGRPIDLATSSGEGMVQVETELRRIAALAPGQG